MKIKLPRLALVAVLLLPLVPLHAAFDPNVVAGDAKWVVYGDLNTLRTTAIGKQLIAAGEKMQAEATKGQIGVDIQKLLSTVGTVTAYGSNFSPNPQDMNGALVIQGTTDLRKIAEAALLQATVTTPDRVSEVTGLSFPAYAISPQPARAAADNDSADAKPAKPIDPAQVVVIAFPPEPVIIVSKSQPQILKARDVLRGKQPSLAKTPSSPLTALAAKSKDAYLFTASAVPSDGVFPADGPQARILQMTSAGSLAIGEVGTLTTAHVELLASSDQSADKLMKILQGTIAMLSLAETNDAQLAEFMNSASVGRNDRTVTLDVSYSSARLAQMIQNFNVPTNVIRGGGNRSGRDPRLENGKVIAEWKSPAVAAKDGAPAVPDTLAWETIENVHLTPASIVTLTSRTTGRIAPGKNARFDRVEVTPAQGGGAPLVFRGEYMKSIMGFVVGPATAVTTGKLLIARTPTSVAQFQFPGGDGSYTVRVGYLTGPDDTTTMSVAVKDPSQPAGDETAKSTDDTARTVGR